MANKTALAPANAPEIPVGVSACLLGQEVRYDGSHSRERYVTDILAQHFRLLPVCPEEAIGMGTPRETVRLVGELAAPRMVAPRSGADWTDRMNRWSKGRARRFAEDELCGFIFKKNSPSCGAYRVKVYQDGGMPLKQGQGLFAAEFMRQHPLVPVEEDGRLNDPGLRENFIERVFALHRLRRVFAGRWSRGSIVEFHGREKYLLMAHDAQALKQLGQLVAAVKQHKPAAFRDLYMAGFMAALGKTATIARHVNTLQHIAGYLRPHLSDDERHRVLAIIEEYRRGIVPLIVPMTIVRHYIELHDVAYVGTQTYLNPHPRELMLRNHA